MIRTENKCDARAYVNSVSTRFCMYAYAMYVVKVPYSDQKSRWIIQASHIVFFYRLNQFYVEDLLPYDDIPDDVKFDFTVGPKKVPAEVKISMIY